MSSSIDRHQWRCLEITTRPQRRTTDTNLKEFVRANWPGLHILYTHSRHVISNVVPGVAATGILNALGDDADEKYEMPDWEQIERTNPNDLWQPNSRLLLLQPASADMPAADALYERLRVSLVRNALPDPLLVLTNGSVWDVLHDPNRHSQLIADPRVHEYLLWDDRGLEESEGELDDAEAWRGVGWIGPRCMDYGCDNPLCLPALLAQDISDSLARLAHLHGRHGCESGGTTLPAGISVEAYIDVLASFLPPFMGRSGWLPTTQGNWGGAKVLRKIDDISLARHLLLDGWLSVWKRDGVRVMHPSSIVLMYWVARELNKRHTEDADEFLHGYDWDSSSWFGGRWRGTKSTTE